ncbi:hypothetical protein F5Y09DRAFT_33451 [Xylaria sp. FL1042]|nr:hypothetical protein F5Y09DRAFT_33451 [Xylaria sp. FL1042]
MYGLLVPTKHPRAPVAPNFFLEVKRENGDPAVMRREACYDAAYGVRAMHYLQNYGQKMPVYDGNAYTFSSTYHSGTSSLVLYAHYSTPPPAVGDRPEYNMTRIRGFDLANDHEGFVTAVTALRNIRDLAKRYRGDIIDAANLRARETEGTPSLDQAQDTNKSHTASLDDSGNHNAPQSDILSRNFPKGATSPHQYPEEDSQDLS